MRTSARGWASIWRGRERGAHAVIGSALSSGLVKIDRSGLVEIEFGSDAELRALNARFRGYDKATNVLAFPNPQTPFGSIILAYDVVAREARAQGKAFAHHTKHLILHGFLHLLGYDHETVMERRLMERLEVRILEDMGIGNPYLVAK